MTTYEHDSRKAAINLRKHGVSFDEAVTVFADPLLVTVNDDQHSWEEERLITIGQSSLQRLLFIVYTQTDYTETDSTVRLIGARLATATERAQHEKAV